MSLNAAALRLMAQKGLSIDDVVEIAAAMEARSPGAERQKRYRDKQRAERNERDVTGDVTPPPKERDQNPLPPASEPNGSFAGARPKSRRKHRLPDDWEPQPLTPGTVCAEIVAAWQPGRIERELSKFRDHHRQRGTLGEDWQAGWRMWIQKSGEFGNGNGRSGAAGGEFGTDSLTAIALQKLGGSAGASP